MASSNPELILDEDLFTGISFDDWHECLRTVLHSVQIGYVLLADCPNPPDEVLSDEERQAIAKWKDDDERVRSHMIDFISNELQERVEGLETSREVLRYLRQHFGELRRNARYDLSRALFQCQMIEEEDVGEHFLKMVDLINRLEKLEFFLEFDLQTDLILQSLPPSFAEFVAGYHENHVVHTHSELLELLLGAQEELSRVKEEDEEGCEASSSSGTKKKKGKKKKAMKEFMGPLLLRAMPKLKGKGKGLRSEPSLSV